MFSRFLTRYFHHVHRVHRVHPLFSPFLRHPRYIFLVGMVVVVGILGIARHVSAHTDKPQVSAGTTYYVSASMGNDANDGLSEEAPFQTIAKVNELALEPGDTVCFRCGDTWRAEMLTIIHSGSADAPLTFRSYPANCDNKPVISGAQPVNGWAAESSTVAVADLSAGANAGRFPHGINQVIRDGSRLPLGRWPNRDTSNGGYSTIDGNPDAKTLVDNELPAINWTGAIAHIKGMRWYILNRVVAGVSGTTLSLEEDAGCWGNDCTEWGYFLNNHRQTLDQEGEWYYDEATQKLYLFTTTVPADGEVEASVVFEGDTEFQGGIILGEHLKAHISYVVVENFDIRHWFANGVTTPKNLESDDNHHLTIHNIDITDVDKTGLKLATWVWKASDGNNGWRGGNALEIANMTIDGANHFGIDSYAHSSSFHDNIVRNIGLIENVGASGLGCGFASGGGGCTENGNGIRVKLGGDLHSAHSNVFERNRVERVGYNGFDIFGHSNTLRKNVIIEACTSKGDCGGVRTFGRTSLQETGVYNLTIADNIIINTIGNTDGANSTYHPLFGMGLYIDSYSRDVTITGNTIISSTIDGILFQRSTGSIENNTLYANNRGTMGRGQVGLYKDETLISSHTGNTLYALKSNAKTLSVGSVTNVTSSDNNRFFHPYIATHISADGTKTLAEWQALSGLDANSQEVWFTLGETEAPRSRIFYNDTNEAKTIDLGNRVYLTLDQEDVQGSIVLQPFTSQILVDNGEVTSPGPTATPTVSPTPNLGTEKVYLPFISK